MYTYCYSIYQHTFPNGKIYIGITSQPPHERWANGKGYSKQPLMYNAIKKYGWENVKHEILLFGLTKEEAEYYERALIRDKHANNRSFGYNCENGGNSIGKCSQETIEKHRKAATGHKHSDETRKLLSEKAMGRPSAFKGRHHSEETKRLLSEKGKGRRHSDESKQKMSEARSGSGNHMYGKTHSDNTKALIRESQRNNFIAVRCVELDIVFESMRDAAKFLEVSYSSLKAVRDKPNRTIKGYHIITEKEDVYYVIQNFKEND